MSSRTIAVVAFLLVAPVSAATPTRSLTLDDRIKAQRRVEEVYWSHRIWPKENPQPKPPLSEVTPDAAIRFKVVDALLKSTALERRFGRPITVKQLQAELDRMARETMDGATLRELFRALGDDPILIAETLARPSLAERLIRGAYAADGALHRPFDSWWTDERARFGLDVEVTPKALALPSIPETACVNDSWIATPLDTRSQHTAVWTGAELIVWGGFNGQLLSTGKIFNPATGTVTATSVGTNLPLARRSHTAVWTGTEMIVWGGESSAFYENRGGRYNPSTNTWLATSTGANVPSIRYLHTAVWTGTEMIIWGGYDGGSTLDTGGRYSPASNTWTAVSTGPNRPTPRRSHTAVWTGTEMIVWGGFETTGIIVNTGARYKPSTDSWTATSIGANVPAERTFHSAVWSGTEMVVWGGYGADYLNTGGRYDPATDHWTSTSVGANVPSARTNHTAVWAGPAMIVWGGDPGTGTFLSSGGRYLPASNTWTPTSLGANVPSGRFSHSVVWSGSEMIVWGGYDGTYPNTGGRYCACWLLFRDADGDGHGDPAVSINSCDGPVPAGYVESNNDCNDANPAICGGAAEINDGIDNQCPGDSGYGSIDEVSGMTGYVTAGDKTKLSWAAQSGATGYDVVRSTARDFQAGCQLTAAVTTSMSDAQVPAPGGIFYFLVRASGPLVGSWGARSSGVERTICPGL